MDEKLEFSWKWRNDFNELELSKWSNKAQESKPIKALKKCWISRPSFIDNAAAWRPQRPPIVCLTSKRESLFFSGRVFFVSRPWFFQKAKTLKPTPSDSFLFFPGQLFVYFLAFSSSSTSSDQVSLLGHRRHWKREYFFSVSEVGTFPVLISFKISSMEAIKRQQCNVAAPNRPPAASI